MFEFLASQTGDIILMFFMIAIAIAVIVGVLTTKDEDKGCIESEECEKCPFPCPKNRTIK